MREVTTAPERESSAPPPSGQEKSYRFKPLRLQRELEAMLAGAGATVLAVARALVLFTAEDWTARVTRSRLEQSTQYHRGTISAALRELADRGVIERHVTAGAVANVYTWTYDTRRRCSPARRGGSRSARP